MVKKSVFLSVLNSQTRQDSLTLDSSFQRSAQQQQPSRWGVYTVKKSQQNGWSFVKAWLSCPVVHKILHPLGSLFLESHWGGIWKTHKQDSLLARTCLSAMILVGQPRWILQDFKLKSPRQKFLNSNVEILNSTFSHENSFFTREQRSAAESQSTSD